MRNALRAVTAASIAAIVALTSLAPASSTPRPAPITSAAPGGPEEGPLSPDWPNDAPGSDDPVETDPEQAEPPSVPGNQHDPGKHDHGDIYGHKGDDGTMPEIMPDRRHQLPDVNDFHRDPRYAKYYHQQLSWTPCAIVPFLQHECAKMTAPRDWYHPNVGDLTVTITRTLVDGKPVHRERLLLTNPGGPGGMALGMSGVVAQMLGLDNSHTPVDVQPRGLVGSTPMDCGVPWAKSSLGADGDTRDMTAKEAVEVSHAMGAWFRECKAKYPDLFPYINTDQTARDFNLVRVLFGYEKMDYVGVSYGTWLGAYLAKAFPRRMDRVVLDSNLGWQATYEYQNHLAMGARQEVHDAAFLPYLARQDATVHLGATARAVDTTIENIRRAAGRHELGGVTPDMVDIVADAGFGQKTLPVAVERLRLLNLAVQGVPEGRAALAGLAQELNRTPATSSVKDTVLTAVVCGDTPVIGNQRRWFGAMNWLQQRLPLTAYSGGVVEGCAEWPYRPALNRGVVNRPFDALLLQNELDPSTPYSGFLTSLRMARGNLTTVFVDNGVGHGAANADGAGSIAQHYLATGQRPSTDVAVTAMPIGDEKVVYEYKSAASVRSPLPCYGDYVAREMRDVQPMVAPAAQPPAGSGGRQLSSVWYPKGDPMWDLFNQYIEGIVKPPKEIL